MNDQNRELNYPRVPSAWKLLLTIVITIFAVELLIMLYLHEGLEQVSDRVFGVIDAVALTVVIFPVLYYWFYKPFVLQINQRQRAEMELKQAYVNIEALVEERTVELEESERRFRSLLEDVELISVILDTKGTITFANSYLQEITGFTREELPGKNWFDIFLPSEHRSQVKNMFDESIAKGAVEKHYENPILTKTGETRDIIWSNTVLYDHQGNISGIATIGEDVTERKQAEESLRDAKERLSRIYDVAPIAFVVWDTERRVTDWNKNAEKTFGWSREDVLGRDFFDFLLPESAKLRVKTIVGRLLKGELPSRSIDENITKDGRTLLVEYNNEILRDKEGKIVGAISLGIDITERKQSEQALIDSENRFRTLSESAFEAVAVHDEGKVILVNKTFVDLFGYERDEIIGMNGLDLVAPESKELVKKNIMQMQLEPYEATFQRKDGSRFIVLVQGKPISYKHQNVRMTTFRDITKRKRAESEREQLLHNLGERIKELRCLYEIAETEQLPDISIEDAFSRIVELIPPSWQYPGIACARISISIDGREFKTPDFRITDWCQSTNIVVEGNVIGAVDVCYLEERPEIDEGPFLKEERDLIEAIAERAGRIIERKRAAQRRQEFEAALHQKDSDIRKAYADVFSAVTGEKLLLLTPEEILAAQGEPSTRPYRVSSFEDLAGSRDFIRSALETRGLAKDDLNSLILASGEVITNGVKHAGSCEVQVCSIDETVQLRISDHGQGIDFSDLPKATLLPGFSTKKSLGMGFAVVLNICDRVLLSTGPHGTTLLLETGGKKEEDSIDDILARGLFKEGAA